jgi:hypothetical protein
MTASASHLGTERRVRDTLIDLLLTEDSSCVSEELLLGGGLGRSVGINGQSALGQVASVVALLGDRVRPGGVGRARALGSALERQGDWVV